MDRIRQSFLERQLRDGLQLASESDLFICILEFGESDDQPVSWVLPMTAEPQFFSHTNAAGVRRVQERIL